MQGSASECWRVVIEYWNVQWSARECWVVLWCVGVIQAMLGNVRECWVLPKNARSAQGVSECQGVPISTRECQGVLKSAREFQDVKRSAKEYQGMLINYPNYHCSDLTKIVPNIEFFLILNHVKFFCYTVKSILSSALCIADCSPLIMSNFMCIFKKNIAQPL